MGSFVSISTDSGRHLPDYQTDSNTVFFETLGAELVFVQDGHGRYLSFYWQLAQKYGISPQKVIDHLPQDSFCPVALEAYVEKLQRIIRYGVPEQYCGLFSYQNQTFPLKLVISPILSGVNEITQVLVMGCSVVEAEGESSRSSGLWELSSESYQTLLTKISRKIRRTLHLETIWQETVEGIGESLQISRCLMLTNELPFQVKAEFCQLGITSLLGTFMQYPQELLESKILENYEPVVWDYHDVDHSQVCSMLMVPTLYSLPTQEIYI
jgi:hypothetical protein